MAISPIQGSFRRLFSPSSLTLIVGLALSPRFGSFVSGMVRPKVRGSVGSYSASLTVNEYLMQNILS